jgi:hypothetical protein
MPAMTDCPFAPSAALRGLAFTGRYRNYTNADTWYPSWAADGHLYSPWTDGYLLDDADTQPFDDSHPGYACNSLDYLGRKAATAQAKIVGDDPLALSLVNLTPRIEADPAPYGGRYPCGSLVVNGEWYYGTYCLRDFSGERCGGVGWLTLGPFVGFRRSRDLGATWVETRHTPAQPLFGENTDLAPIRIGAPHFVDLGQNLQHSPDGKAYLVAHGATRPEACNNWIQGDQVYLLRVSPEPDAIEDPQAYEFFAGHDPAGRPRWTRSLAKMQPLLAWDDHLGCVTVTYNAPLGKYLLCVTRGVRAGHYDTLFLEAEALTGPWRLFCYWRDFGPEAYFVNLPSKFISGDGRTVWVCYSANHSNKNGAATRPAAATRSRCTRRPCAWPDPGAPTY